MPDKNEATKTADLYGRQGDPDPGDWTEKPAVTARPNDLVKDKVSNSTFADRAKASRPTQAKAVENADAENKAMKSGRAAKK